jgi:glycosyltransferase involved in cell wall biosynthesis
MGHSRGKITKKVVFVGLLPPVINGQSIVTQKILKFLIDKEVNLSVLSLPDFHQPQSLKEKFLKLLSYTFLNFKLFYKSGFTKKIVYLSGARSVVGFYRNAPMIVWCTLIGHKTIMHFHCGDYTEFLSNKSSFFKLINKRILGLLDRIVILGENIKPNFSITHDIESKLRVVPNGIALNDACLPKKLPSTCNDPVQLLFLSNLIESKGYLDVLKAVNILVHHFNYKNIVCNFCGSFMVNSDDCNVRTIDDAIANFNNYINKNSLEKNAIFCGVVTGEKKETLLNTSHIFLLPTAYNTEGQPLSILECMSHGQVVIATKYRAIPDMVIDELTGLLVNYGEAHAIAGKIHRLIQNPELFTKLSANAISHVSKNFDISLQYKKMYTIFQELDLN